MSDTEVNTTKRWSSYCRALAKDGRVCSLYAPHESEFHVEKNGASKWKDGE